MDARKEFIQKHYLPLHPHLYQFSLDLFDDNFVRAIQEFDRTQNKVKLLSNLKKHTETGLYSFPFLKPTYCQQLLEELDFYVQTGLPVESPNSMNNYGLIIDHIGMSSVITQIREQFISKLSRLLYPSSGGDTLDSHHAFVVSYKQGEDIELDFHYDTSEVTLNVCLGRTFTGGQLYFKGLCDQLATYKENYIYSHVPGVALIHVVKHRHGAMKILSGERHNLIIWFLSTQYTTEQQNCPVEAENRNDDF